MGLIGLMSRSYLEYIHPENLHQYWDDLKSDIELVLDRSNSSVEWIPEDVYMSIKQNTSYVIVGFDGESNSWLGSIVLTPQPGYCGLELHIWTLCNRTDHCLIQNHMDDIVGFAKKLGAKKLTFSSNRKGWNRAGKRLGFIPTLQQYELRVT